MREKESEEALNECDEVEVGTVDYGVVRGAIGIGPGVTPLR